MCGCTEVWACPRCREGGIWQDNGDVFIPDPQIESLDRRAELLISHIPDDTTNVPVRRL